jgi:FkbM family methyltransferase
MLQLSKPSRLNQSAKQAAKPLSRVAVSQFLRRKVRLVEIYLAFLQGKGSGTGWDIREEVNIAKKLVFRKNPVILDVGANVGDWSKYFLQAIPTAKIYIVEPVEECQKEIRALNLPNTTLIPSAVGKQKGVGLLHTPSKTAGIASLFARRDTFCQEQNADFHTLSINITTIDDIVAEHSIEFIDFLKMDIEGNEYNALLGAEQALKDKKIGAFSFEFGSGNINSRVFFHDFWDFISPQFEIYRMTPSGILLEIDEYYEDLEYYRGVSNYVAILKA